MEQLKERKDVDPRFTWDFTDLFPTDEAWEQELESLKGEVAGFAAVKGTLGDSAANLKAGLPSEQRL